MDNRGYFENTKNVHDNKKSTTFSTYFGDNSINTEAAITTTANNSAYARIKATASPTSSVNCKTQKEKLLQEKTKKKKKMMMKKNIEYEDNIQHVRRKHNNSALNLSTSLTSSTYTSQTSGKCKQKENTFLIKSNNDILIPFQKTNSISF